MTVTGIDDGEDVDPELLTGIYERVRACEFQPSADHVLQVVKVEQMILGKKPVCTQTLVKLFLLLLLLSLVLLSFIVVYLFIYYYFFFKPSVLNSRRWLKKLKKY